MALDLPGWLAALRATSPLIFLAVAISTALILFAPPDVAATIGLDTFRDTYRPMLGGALVLSTAIVLVNVLHKFGIGISNRYQKWLNTRRWHKNLRELTPDEKAYLVQYIEKEQNTMYFLMDDGVARGLEAKSVLYRPSNLFDMIEGAGFNLQPWAKWYLQKHPECLERAAKFKPKRH